MMKSNSLISVQARILVFSPQHLSILWSILGISVCISKINQLNTKLYNIKYIRHKDMGIAHTPPTKFCQYTNPHCLEV